MSSDRYTIDGSVPPEYLVGVDLGQAHDYTAICILQKNMVISGETQYREKRSPYGSGAALKVPYQARERAYQVRHLERLPLNTSYPKQVQAVKDTLEQLKAQQLKEHAWPNPKPRTPLLVVDQTGVGRPVVDMLRDAGLHLHAMTITGGDSTTRDGMDYRVPKRELVSVLQVLLQDDRLTVAAGLREADTLVKELLAFKVTISDKGHDSYGNDWRENPHDDMVLAVALAAWMGENTILASARRNQRQ